MVKNKDLSSSSSSTSGPIFTSRSYRNRHIPLTTSEDKRAQSLLTGGWESSITLRTETQGGASIFECKTSDVVALTAAVAPLAGLSEMRGLWGANEDRLLITSAETVF